MAIGFSSSSSPRVVAPSRPNSSPFVLVTPSPLSVRLIPRLLLAGYRVKTLAPSDAHAHALRRLGCHVIRGSFLCLQHVKLAARACLCAVIVAPPPHSSRDANNLRTIVTNMLAACTFCSVRRIILLTSEIAVFSHQPLTNVDESISYPHPRSAQVAFAQELESLLRNADSARLRCVIFRIRLLWGLPHDPLLAFLCRHPVRRTIALVNGGRFQTSTCHADNACEAIECALRIAPPSQVYFITDGHSIMFSDFVTALLSAYGAHQASAVVVRVIPFWFAWLAAVFFQMLAFVFRGYPAITTDTIAFFASDMTFSDRKARIQLGYRGRTSIQDGMRNISALSRRATHAVSSSLQ